MSKKELLSSGYDITSDMNFMKTLYPVPHELNIQLDTLYNLALKGKKSSIKNFITLIEKYPKVPALKNYLSVLYSNMDNMDKSYEVNHWIVAEHPEYVFGKINMAIEYYLKKEYSKIPEVLGKSMDLKKLYPERDTFHIVEVSGFFKIAILYLSAVGEMEQAQIRLDILMEIAPESDDLEIAKTNFHIAKMKNSYNNFSKTNKDSVDVDVKKTILTDIETQPEFNHKQINLLYENDFLIDKNLITDILKLPRQSLIEDLNKVLDDSIIRFNFFSLKADNEDFDDKYFYFVMHALFLLAEIEASESVENILEVLRQDDEYMDFYLGDTLTEFMWLVIYKTAYPKLDIYKKYMFEPGLYTFCKASVSEMVNQTALHQTNRRNEVIEWYRDIFRFFLKSSNKENVIDSNLIGSLIHEVLDFKGVELMPEIEKLYEKEIVDLLACGDLKEVKKYLADPKDRVSKEKIISIFDLYKKIQTWNANDYNSDDDYNEEEYISTNSYNDEQQVRTSNKVDRNDPCPCGSGKKYKKCCIDKNN